MTLRPVEPARVTIDPRRYTWCPALERPSRCAVPGCPVTYRLEGHHVIPRSQTGGPLDYVTVDGVVLPNVVTLCREHHADVTGGLGGHRAAIRHEPDGPWVWFTRDGEGWARVGPLRLRD